MNRHRTTSDRIARPLRSFLLTMLFAFAPAGGAVAQGDALFIPLAAAAAAADQSRSLDLLRQVPTTRSIELVRINGEALRGPTATMALADGPAQATRHTTLARSGDDFTWIGEMPGGAGEATLVVRGGNVTGSIRKGKDLYRVAPVGGGVHALVSVDESRFPPEHPPTYTQRERRGDSRGLPALQDVPPGTRSQIDVLVPYTAAPRAAVPDIQALIQLAVDETNQSYRNSQINIDLRLVGTLEIPYVEAGKSWDDVMADLEAGTEASMAQVHSQRDATRADLVALVFTKNDFCGLADAILADAPTGFALVYWDCATGYYSFGHELGHLMGARHDPANDPSASPFAHGHGFQHPPWRTIMAYNCTTPCTRLQYWSNPNVSFQGVAMGTAASHDNARVLNQTRPTIAGFR